MNSETTNRSPYPAHWQPERARGGGVIEPSSQIWPLVNRLLTGLVVNRCWIQKGCLWAETWEQLGLLQEHFHLWALVRLRVCLRCLRGQQEGPVEHNSTRSQRKSSWCEVCDLMRVGGEGGVVIWPFLVHSLFLGNSGVAGQRLKVQHADQWSRNQEGWGGGSTWGRICKFLWSPDWSFC